MHATRRPPRSAGVLPRDRLTRRLALVHRHPVTVVTAPAGYGKTVALAQWQDVERGAGRRVHGAGLDPEDVDPARFWAGLVRLLRTGDPRLGARALALLRSGEPTAELDAVRTLAEDLGDCDPLVLVLDDYHLAGDAVDRGMARLVDALPASVRLVLGGRSVPGLPLPRWRVEGLLDELGPEDLRFTPAETHELLVDRLGLPLGPAELAEVERLTEGWMGGLRLLALHLSRTGSVADLSAGTSRFTQDYLAEEVLRGQPAPVRDFLTDISVLDRLTAPLCAAVTQRSDCQRMLELLDREHLFVVPLDGERHCYRYHPMFADFLRSRLARSPDRLRLVHQRAAEWYVSHGRLEEAITHCLAGAAWARAAELIDRAGEAALARGEVATVDRWLRRLPAAQWADRPALFLRRAEVAMRRAEWGTVADAVREAERAFAAAPGGVPGQPPRVRATLAALAAYLATVAGETERAVTLADAAVDLIGDTDPAAASAILLTKGRAESLGGRLPAAMATFREAMTRSRAAGDGPTLLTAAGGLGRTRCKGGRLHAAAATYEDGLRDAESLAGGTLAAAGALHAGLGEVLHEWNRLDEAARHLERAVELGRRGELLNVVLFGSLTLALARQAAGDEPAADAAVTAAERVLGGHELPERSARLIDDTRLRLWVIRGDRAAVERWRRTVTDPAARLHPLTRARLHLAVGRPDTAERLLRAVVTEEADRGALGAVIGARVLQATARLAAGDPAGARSALAHALELAEPEGYVRTFLDEGEAVTGLLRTMYASPGRFRDYLRTLLAAAAAGRPGTGPAAPVLLTPRERQILRLLGAGLSNTEIAARLFVSTGTVKKHLYNLFGKLGVKTRLEAVVVARSLGLLQPDGR
ncbi:MAG: Transcriptional activator of maltose regulon, MalT [uncultured Corynebacteriales bacterium]|uniref:Transcriptional activator of maltose regulon, MalT n=1 Tax=uncultured Mycobacteriales bacterium TaxID=581187 RepID=A0A6J4JLH4_9ACTN|nr:MAG: Transcriptional activator of maltose regulon, MalT [uncultured Corynebacteriales bacterium]